MKHTPEERAALVARVDELRAGGRNLKESCAQVGILEYVYYAWRKGQPATRGRKPLSETCRRAQIEHHIAELRKLCDSVLIVAEAKEPDYTILASSFKGDPAILAAANLIKP